MDRNKRIFYRVTACGDEYENPHVEEHSSGEIAGRRYEELNESSKFEGVSLDRITVENLRRTRE